MFPDFRPSTFPAPFVANGSIARVSPASTTSPPSPPTFGTDFPAWRWYRSIVWPVRFEIGLNPYPSIARPIAAPIRRVGGFGRPTSLAVSHATSPALIRPVQLRGPTPTPAAGAAIDPSNSAPG